jgi:hypothetical protein
MAFMNWAWPRNDPSEFQAIELSLAVIPFVNVDANNRMAVAVSRKSVELARAPVSAIAMRKLTSFEHPLHVGHAVLRPATTV